MAVLLVDSSLWRALLAQRHLKPRRSPGVKCQDAANDGPAGAVAAKRSRSLPFRMSTKVKNSSKMSPLKDGKECIGAGRSQIQTRFNWKARGPSKHLSSCLVKRQSKISTAKQYMQ
jgi:hypothetical protein